MKTPLWVGIGVVLLASIGCRSTSEKMTTTATPTARALPPPPPPITSEMITEANCKQMFERLKLEVDHDGQGEY